MSSEIIKILRFLFNITKIANFIYIPTGDRLAIVSSFDLARDPEISTLTKSRSIREYIGSIEIIGSASTRHSYGFIKLYEGKAILKQILSNSTFVNTNNDIDEFIDELLEMTHKMSENDPF